MSTTRKRHPRRAHYEQGRGAYFQLVRSYREGGKVRQEVLVHLGTHERSEDALTAWPSEVAHLRKIWWEEQAGKLEANLEKLRALTETGCVQSRYRVADIV